ncbi:MAG: DUF3592 domain-containing protein [Anaerolineae bacterium]|nr:DUF3592 domain-containing protein [Anaerolineae bacterium]
MTETDYSPSKEVLRSLRLLRSPDPEDRKRAIRFLSSMRSDPRVQAVFEHMYKKDPDPAVRQLAWRAIWPADPSVPAPAPREEAPPFELAPEPTLAELVPPPAAPPSAAPPPVVRRSSRRESRAWRQPFLLNPSNVPLVEQERARRARRKKTARWTFRLGALLLLLMAVLWGVLVPEWVRWFQFEWDGVTVAGTVTERQQRADSYFVRYDYTVGGQSYAGEQRVTESAYEALADGAAVSVRALPDDPAEARLEANSPEDRFRNYLTAVVAGLTLAALLMLLSAVLRRRRALRIVPPAVLTGQVVACEGVLDDDGDFKVKVRFRFVTPHGQTLTGQARQIRNDLRDRPMPPLGAPVAVYYRHEQSYRLL